MAEPNDLVFQVSVVGWDVGSEDFWFALEDACQDLFKNMLEDAHLLAWAIIHAKSLVHFNLCLVHFHCHSQAKQSVSLQGLQLGKLFDWQLSVEKSLGGVGLYELRKSLWNVMSEDLIKQTQGWRLQFIDLGKIKDLQVTTRYDLTGMQEEPGKGLFHLCKLSRLAREHLLLGKLSCKRVVEGSVWVGGWRVMI